MFGLTRPRSHSQSMSPNIPYRAPDYYMPPAQHPSHIQNIASSSIPRHFNGDDHRTDNYYAEPNFYGDSRKTYTRENVPSMLYNQSYDRRHPNSPELHLPSTSYRSHYTDRGPVSSSLHHMKRQDMSPMLDDFSLASPHGNFAAESGQGFTTPSERSVDSEFWAPSQQQHHPHSPPPASTIPPATHADPPKPKKPRREKPRIELAPDQPPTTQGKPRARVYVACIQCRTRKIRCDGAKPTCHNCGRRSVGSNECTYDPVPKRRGPDKCPGARQRMARVAQGESDTPRRRRRSTTTRTDGTSNNESDNSAHSARQESSSQSLTLVPLTPVVPEHTVCTPSNDFAPSSNYGRQYSPECGCHGLVHCPDYLEANNALGDSRKASVPSAGARGGDSLNRFGSYSPYFEGPPVVDGHRQAAHQRRLT